MADQQYRAGVFRQFLLQQVEGFQIEVIGRLVEHQQVGPAGEGTSQGEPGPLAARQYADRGASLLGAEQEVLHVADHMAAFAAYRHRIAAAAGHRLRQSPLGVKALPPLIDRDRRQVGAEPDRPRIRGEGADQ